MRLAKHFSVRFQYDFPKNDNGVPTRITTCSLVSVKPRQKPENGKVLASSTVARHQNDADCKVLARKFALTAAMKQAKLSKKDRTLIWKDYFSQTKVLSGGKAVSK